MMTKKKIELNDEIDRVLNQYLEASGQDMNQVINQALKEYLLKHLGFKDCRELFQKQDKDTNLSKYADELLRSSINDNY